MKKIFLLSLWCLMVSPMNAGWKKKFKKAAKIKHVTHAVHAITQVVRVVDHNVTNPVVKQVAKPVGKKTARTVQMVNNNVTQPVVNHVVKPIVHETQHVIGALDKNITQPVVNTIKPVTETIKTPVQQLIKLSHIEKELSSVEKLALKSFKTVEHELSKVAQKVYEKPTDFLSDILVDIQKELVDHACHEIMKLDNKELHLLFIKTVKGGAKVFKGGFLLEAKPDLFQAVVHYFLPLPITGITTAADIIENTDAINNITKHYNTIISELESKNLQNISVTPLNEYATLLIKHQLEEERDNSVTLLTLTKNIGKGIETTIEWLDEHRVQVPNHLPGDVDLK